MLARFVLYALLGILLESIFTGLHSFFIKKDYSATCKTHLPMGIVWGTGGLGLESLIRYYHGFNFALLGTLWIFFIEYVSGGIILTLFDTRLWDYSHSQASVDGFIRLDYAPFWAILAILFQFYIKPAVDLLVMP